LHKAHGISAVDAWVQATESYKEYKLVLDRKISLEIGLDEDLPPMGRFVPTDEGVVPLRPKGK
jgi:hypothetical protein